MGPAKIFWLTVVLQLAFFATVWLAAARVGTPVAQPLRAFGMFNVLLAAGLSLVVARGVLPPALTLGLANVLQVAALATCWHASNLLRDERDDARPWIVWGVGSAAIVAFDILGMPDARITATLAAMVVILLWGGGEHARARRAAGDHGKAAGLQAATTMMALGMAFHVGHGWWTGTPLNADGDRLENVLIAGVAWLTVTAINGVVASSMLSRVLTQLREQSLRDPLTGLLNRRAMDERIAQAWAAWRERREPFALLLLDLDHFKSINDTLGHAVGDEVLGEVAGALSRALRHGDVLSRHGGEEFLVLVRAPLSEPSGVAQRLRDAVRAIEPSAAWHGRAVTVSIGVSVVGEADASTVATMKRADDALYRAKAAGRDRFVLAGEALGVPAVIEGARHGAPEGRAAAQAGERSAVDAAAAA